MRQRLPWTGAAFAIAVALLPMKAGGCGGKTACIITRDGTCPSPAKVMQRFSDPCFGGNIISVDGDPSLDGDLCCYPVTESDSEFFGDFGCEGGFAGAGGFTGAGGFGAAGGFGGSTGGAGGSFCISCGEQLSQPGPIALLCSGADQLWNAVTSCGCTNCPDVCSDNLCLSAPFTSDCQNCLFAQCSAELNSCNDGF